VLCGWLAGWLASCELLRLRITRKTNSPPKTQV
jgi:hypothetical protein